MGLCKKVNAENPTERIQQSESQRELIPKCLALTRVTVVTLVITVVFENNQKPTKNSF